MRPSPRKPEEPRGSSRGDGRGGRDRPERFPGLARPTRCDRSAPGGPGRSLRRRAPPLRSPEVAARAGTSSIKAEGRDISQLEATLRRGPHLRTIGYDRGSVRPETAMKPNWSFLARFKAPHRRLAPQWDAVVAWVASARDALITSEAELADGVEMSDRALAGFERDPLHHDWSRFRPLRLLREEDWSDWIAHLV